MESQINKLTKLIGDLLDVKKMQLGKIAYSDTLFSLAACVAETVENMRAVTTKHQLLIEGTIDRPVYGDPDRIGQVISNLVSNAIKYSPAADRVEIRLAEDAGQAIVAVRDYGIGIDQRYQGQIFERFFRVTDDIQQTFPGMGIGLYLSAEIVERHGGRIWVESTKGQGATFSFALLLTSVS
jgi:signal transduction histidine kinase